MKPASSAHVISSCTTLRLDGQPTVAAITVGNSCSFLLQTNQEHSMTTSTASSNLADALCRYLRNETHAKQWRGRHTWPSRNQHRQAIKNGKRSSCDRYRHSRPHSNYLHNNASNALQAPLEFVPFIAEVSKRQAAQSSQGCRVFTPAQRLLVARVLKQEHQASGPCAECTAMFERKQIVSWRGNFVRNRR